MKLKLEDLKVGQRVRIHHTIDRREGDWRCAVEGVVQAIEKKTTGSWYAHSKDNKWWLMRVQLQKDGGEISSINIDSLAEIELLDAAPTST
jgi:hypothetical protein